MPVIDEMPITKLRDSLGPRFSEVVQSGRPVFVERNKRDHGALVSQALLWRLLEPYEFRTQVYRDDQSVSIWLDEFNIYGRGKDFEAACADLVEEVREYVLSFFDEPALYLSAPNRAHHLPHVVKAAVADIRGELEEALFAEPAPAAAPAGEPEPVHA